MILLLSSWFVCLSVCVFRYRLIANYITLAVGEVLLLVLTICSLAAIFPRVSQRARRHARTHTYTHTHTRTRRCRFILSPLFTSGYESTTSQCSAKQLFSSSRDGFNPPPHIASVRWWVKVYVNIYLVFRGFCCFNFFKL